MTAVIATLVASCSGPSATPTPPTAITATSTTTSTTSSTSTDDSTNVEPSEAASIAVIGCSQTRDAVHGFNDLSPTPLFGSDADQEYLSAGTIDRWAATNGGHWRAFTALHEDDPAVEAIWLMLCWHVPNTDPATSIREVADIIERAHAVIGRPVPVYVSGLNDWDPRNSCPRGDWERSWTLAEEAVEAGLARAGPDLGPITREQTTDGCHGNADGNRVMGSQLADFFLTTQ
jgi:hypothetical protein